MISTAFVTIGVMLAVQLTRKGQWTTNRIASMFTLLVLACGLGHAGHALLLAGPNLGLFGEAGLASRVTFTDWHMWVADGAAAVAGVFYVLVRTRDRDILQTTRAFEDFQAHRARAIEVHDRVVQELVEARVALQAGQRDEAEDALGRGLRASQRIISRVRAPGAAEPDEASLPGPKEVVRSDA